MKKCGLQLFTAQQLFLHSPFFGLNSNRPQAGMIPSTNTEALDTVQSSHRYCPFSCIILSRHQSLSQEVAYGSYIRGHIEHVKAVFSELRSLLRANYGIWSIVFPRQKIYKRVMKRRGRTTEYTSTLASFLCSI